MEELEEETLKMLNKIETMVLRVETSDAKGEEMFTNMKAYISDSKHFLKTRDLIRAFECAVWAWAIMELCEELDVFKLAK
jgi:uncharacterized protein